MSKTAMQKAIRARTATPTPTPTPAATPIQSLEKKEMPRMEMAKKAFRKGAGRNPDVIEGWAKLLGFHTEPGKSDAYREEEARRFREEGPFPPAGGKDTRLYRR